MSRSGSEIRASENQSRFIQDRIGAVERHFGDLCTNFAAYGRKSAKLRDKGDEIAISIRKYAENESHNHTTKAALAAFTENFSAVQDYRNAQIRRFEDRVLGPLESYGNSCKHAKNSLRKAFAARNKEIKQKKAVEKVRDRNPSDRHTISKAETDLQRASVDASRSSKSLEEEMDSFERKKLTDIKKILQEFVNVEMIFHAKALEMYTQCFQNLNSISEDEDLEEFRNSLRPATAQGRLELQRASSKTSLNSTMNSTSTTPKGTPSHGRRPPPAAFTVSQQSSRNQPQSQSTSQRSSMYSDENGQDEDEESEEETDEESEEEDDDDDQTEDLHPVNTRRK